MHCVLTAAIIIIISLMIFCTLFKRVRSELFRVRGGGERETTPLLDSDHIPTPEYFDGAPAPTTGEYISHDIDPEFVSSRERMGACSGKLSRSSFGRAAVYTQFSECAEDLDKKSDDVFDGNRTITLGRRACKPSDASAVRLLYTDVMGLTNPPPSADDCEYINASGISYKEPCLW